MAREFGNRIAVLTTTNGQGSVTLGQVLSNAFQTFAEAGITDGAEVTYFITEGNDFEIGIGTYHSAGPTLDRDTVVRSKIGGTADITKMNLLGSATVRVDALATDVLKLAFLTVTQNVDVDAMDSKLAGIETGATADQTGAEIKSAYEGEADTNAFTDAYKSKVDGIEAGADVTDATNVSAAGAALKSSNLSDLTNKPTAFSNIKQNATTAATGVLQQATAAQYQGDTAGVYALTPQYVWDAAEEITLTESTTVTVNMANFINAVLTLTASRTMGNPTNEKVGQMGYIRVVQGNGSDTLSWSSDWEFAAGTAPVLSTGAGQQDILFYTVLATNRVLITPVLAVL